MSQLAGGTVNVGAAGSGVPPLMGAVLAANGLEPGRITLQQQPTTPAVVDLLAGRIDALALASAPESLMVQMLLRTPGVRLFDFAQAEAYSRRFAFLSAVQLPRGVVDLARDLPPADLRLVAPTASLVAREGLHPALVQLFVQAAQQVHGGAGWFQRRGEFPNARASEWPIAAEAQRFYRNGVPWLQRWLPFWLANLADRMWLALLAIIGAADPAGAGAAAALHLPHPRAGCSAGMPSCARSRRRRAGARPPSCWPSWPPSTHGSAASPCR